MIAAYFTRVGRVDTPAADNKAELGTLPRPADAPETLKQKVEKTFGELPIGEKFYRFLQHDAWEWTKLTEITASPEDYGDNEFSEFTPDELVFVFE